MHGCWHDVTGTWRNPNRSFRNIKGFDNKTTCACYTTIIGENRIEARSVSGHRRRVNTEVCNVGVDSDVSDILDVFQRLVERNEPRKVIIGWNI
ncbi:hypothetical protein D3C71_899290 [compost metagenome]